MTKEIASRFLAGGEMMSDGERKAFEGRVFKDKKSGATIVLSGAAFEFLRSQIPADQLPGMSPEAINQKLAELLGRSEWATLLTTLQDYNNVKAGKISPKDHLTISSDNILLVDQNFIFLFPPPLSPRQWPRLITLSGGSGKVVDISPELLNQWLAKEGLKIHWGEKLNTLVVDDGYQVRYYFDQDKNEWIKVFPHERRAGEYELLTPRQRMEKAMADLKSITGYDGSGVWTEGPKTVVDYTDAQGKKHHQELNVYFVHANQDPQSLIVYEVLQDPETDEMMFTIRESNHKDIKGLNEQQAALVRQAWAYLLSADPQVMQKFWRVNKVGGVGVKPSLIAPGTNYLINGQFGLILPKSIDENVAHLILGESYELYAAQFGWKEAADGKGGIIYVNPPPDCLDLEPEIEAQKKILRWLEVYDSNNTLFPNIRQIATAIIQGYPYLSRQCQPQIPFEP